MPPPITDARGRLRHGAGHGAEALDLNIVSSDLDCCAVDMAQVTGEAGETRDVARGDTVSRHRNVPTALLGSVASRA